MLSDLERLVAIDAIKAMRARFCRALDARDWETLAEMLTENVSISLANDSGNAALGMAEPVEFVGRENFLAFVKQLTGNGRMIHVATMPDIEVHGADRAHGLWLMQGYSEAAKERGLMLGIGYETIEDEYVHLDGKWRIESITARLQAIL